MQGIGQGLGVSLRAHGLPGPCGHSSGQWQGARALQGHQDSAQNFGARGDVYHWQHDGRRTKSRCQWQQQHESMQRPKNSLLRRAYVRCESHHGLE
jgi:hypothetical protein